jgi:cell filamentation protein
MELTVLDPFGDYETAGYLQNLYQEKNLNLVGHLETAAFEQEIVHVVRSLRKAPKLTYEHVTTTHQNLFHSVYPWAGQDRSTTAPGIAIVKGGYKKLFAHPADVQRASEYALQLGQDRTYLRAHPGEVFGYLAHAHPFLEGNGRTILTIFAELSRRAGFHIEWEAMDTAEFLVTLTRELLEPGKATMDQFVLPFLKEGVLSVERTASRLRVNFKRSSSAS